MIRSADLSFKASISKSNLSAGGPFHGGVRKRKGEHPPPGRGAEGT